LGRVDEAGAAFDRAIALDPDDPDGPIGAARVALERGEAAAAAERLEPVVRRWPDYGRAVRLLGRAWQEAGEPDKARTVLSGTISDTKYLVDPWAKKVQAMKVGMASEPPVDAGQGDDGSSARVDVLERLASDRPDDMTVLEQLVLALERDARGDRALELLLERRSLHPDHHRVLLLLAGANERRGDLASAIRHTRLAIDKRPEFATAHLELGRLLLASGDPEGALGEVLEAKRLGASGVRLEELLARARVAAEGAE
jgi:tetratricopeptide (TPR) repeat protein